MSDGLARRIASTASTTDHATVAAVLRELAASFDEHEAKWSETFEKTVSAPSHYVEGYLDAISDQATGLRALAREIAALTDES
jgi:hypothetical protein